MDLLLIICRYDTIENKKYGRGEVRVGTEEKGPQRDPLAMESDSFDCICSRSRIFYWVSLELFTGIGIFRMAAKE